VFADGYAPAANADPGLVAAASISLLCLLGGTPRLLCRAPPLADEMGIPDRNAPCPAFLLRTPWVWNDHGTITFPARAIIFSGAELDERVVRREREQRRLKNYLGVSSGRLTNSNMATWVFSSQDSSVSPQTLQFA
jgi:hypothetical protein